MPSTSAPGLGGPKDIPFQRHKGPQGQSRSTVYRVVPPFSTTVETELHWACGHISQLALYRAVQEGMRDAKETGLVGGERV